MAIALELYVSQTLGPVLPLVGDGTPSNPFTTIQEALDDGLVGVNARAPGQRLIIHIDSGEGLYYNGSWAVPVNVTFQGWNTTGRPGLASRPVLFNTLNGDPVLTFSNFDISDYKTDGEIDFSGGEVNPKHWQGLSHNGADLIVAGTPDTLNYTVDSDSDSDDYYLKFWGFVLKDVALAASGQDWGNFDAGTSPDIALAAVFSPDNVTDRRCQVAGFYFKNVLFMGNCAMYFKNCRGIEIDRDCSFTENNQGWTHLILDNSLDLRISCPEMCGITVLVDTDPTGELGFHGFAAEPGSPDYGYIFGKTENGMTPDLLISGILNIFGNDVTAHAHSYEMRSIRVDGGVRIDDSWEVLPSTDLIVTDLTVGLKEAWEADSITLSDGDKFERLPSLTGRNDAIQSVSGEQASINEGIIEAREKNGYSVANSKEAFANFHNGQGGTICMTFSVEQTDNLGSLIQNNNATTETGFGIIYDNRGSQDRINLHARPDVSGFSKFSADIDIDDGEVHTLVAVYGPTSIQLYIDGVEVMDESVGSWGVDGPADNDLSLFSAPDGDGEAGVDVQEIKVYDTIFTSTMAIYYAMSQGTY